MIYSSKLLGPHGDPAIVSIVTVGGFKGCLIVFDDSMVFDNITIRIYSYHSWYDSSIPENRTTTASVLYLFIIVHKYLVCVLKHVFFLHILG